MNKNSYLKKILLSKLFMLLVLLIIVLAVFTILSGGDFFNLRNIRNILSSLAVVAFLTVGAGMLLVSGCLDLSVGPIGTLSGVVMAIILLHGAPWPVAVIAGLAVAGGIGFINALLVTRFKLQAFITTLAVGSIISGIAITMTAGRAVHIRDDFIIWVGSHMLFGFLPVSVLLALIVFLIYGIILSKTNFGKKVYLVGGNPQAAYLAGLNYSRIIFILFINNAMLAGLSGILLGARMNLVSPGLAIAGGGAVAFAGLIAAILGGISFGGGKGGLLGAFVGLLIINSFSNGMTIIGLGTHWQTVASGVLFLIALTIDFILEKSQTRLR